MDIKKTNAARILDRQKISYELIPYKVDENDLGAQHVADSLGEDINQVFKTILVHGDKIGYLVCVVPGNLEVDLKGAAKVSGNKKIDTVPLKDLTPLTGYIRGGCSPLGLKKNFPIFIHETAMQFPYIYVSARKGDTRHRRRDRESPARSPRGLRGPHAQQEAPSPSQDNGNRGNHRHRDSCGLLRRRHGLRPAHRTRQRRLEQFFHGHHTIVQFGKRFLVKLVASTVFYAPQRHALKQHCHTGIF